MYRVLRTPRHLQDLNLQLSWQARPEKHKILLREKNKNKNKNNLHWQSKGQRNIQYYLKRKTKTKITCIDKARPEKHKILLREKNKKQK